MGTLTRAYYKFAKEAVRPQSPAPTPHNHEIDPPKPWQKWEVHSLERLPQRAFRLWSPGTVEGGLLYWEKAGKMKDNTLWVALSHLTPKTLKRGLHPPPGTGSMVLRNFCSLGTKPWLLRNEGDREGNSSSWKGPTGSSNAEAQQNSQFLLFSLREISWG